MKDNISKKLATIFKEHGHSLYLVGGAVRDRLLGIIPEEQDFTTDANPGQIKTLLKLANPTHIYTIGEKFGTIGAFFNDQKIEITTYRSEKYQEGSRHPEVKFGTSLKGDLSRRDFTINAIAYDPIKEEYIDPFNGRQDLKNKLIVVVGNTADRFREDPLRILRAIRFSLKLNFTLDTKTLTYIKNTVEDIASISSERIAQEMDKILTAEKPSQAINLMTEISLINYIIPEIIALKNVQHEANEHKNIYQHTLTVLDNVPATKQLRWLALLHDIAKPQTKKVENGEVHFLFHETVGAKMAKNILQRLHYDNQFISNITTLIKYHLRVNLYNQDWTDGAVRRLMLEIGDLLDDLVTFSYADITSAKQSKVDAGHNRIDQFKQRAKEVLEKEELSKIKSPLSGDELMKIFDRPAGPWIKPIKDHLLNLVIEGELSQNDKASAEKIAKEIIDKYLQNHKEK